LRLKHPDFLERLELTTYDLRMRAASHFPEPAATNLAFVAMEESSIQAVKDGSVGFHFGLYWPREVYGRVVDELSREGAKTVAFDILFGELRPDHPTVETAKGDFISSDTYFAVQCRRAGNVVLAVTPEVTPPPLFATNAFALADISTEKDADGVLRRVKTFRIYRHWNPLIEEAAGEFNLDLGRATVLPGKIILPQTGTTNTVEIPIDAQTNFSLADFGGDKLPAGVPPRARAFADRIVWHMGVVLAAEQLGLDLRHPDIDLPHGRITLLGRNGFARTIPVDADGYFYIDWQLPPNDPRLLRAPIERLLAEDYERIQGRTNGLSDSFRGKLVVVGSAAQGNDLTDRGATPLRRDTLLVSKHWNVAKSIITGRFIRRASVPVELALIIGLGVLTAWLTLGFRAFVASAAVFLLMAGYLAAAFVCFIEYRYWLPLIYPLAGAVLMEHVLLVTYRVVFEEQQKRRVRSVFSKIVSPEVVNELLGAEKLSLGGARREVTVLFADVRGFTKLTDEMQESAAAYVRTHDLSEREAELFFDLSASETLHTVNQYLTVVADAIKKHDGTLDKYIGDCVMAFWGAPIPNSRHALCCVRAAIESQQAIRQLNERRMAENPAIEVENRAREAAGLPPKFLRTSLMLGTGINTGLVTVGLMGSDAHILNYTIFGREVNLASRLEGVSGSGRIIISDTTYNHLLREDPALASTCVEMFPVTVKGIKAAVRVYEMPWSSNLKPAG
ncbi:MAG TPA: adenylate/guanylate cyclase domain-containing protein, partial [Verrucomicrobiae bacterium]|nr:adenylate/guanylate cyclase domain-containing protein [Verrucomicrobiae bacterium]